MFAILRLSNFYIYIALRFRKELPTVQSHTKSEGRLRKSSSHPRQYRNVKELLLRQVHLRRLRLAVPALRPHPLLQERMQRQSS